MGEFALGLLKEAKDYPLATFLLLLIVITAMAFFLLIFPKLQKSRNKNQAEMIGHIASSNEIIRHSSAVIENNSRALENNTQAMELTRQALGNMCGRMDQLQDRFEDHDRTAQTVLNKEVEILATLRK